MHPDKLPYPGNFSGGYKLRRTCGEAVLSIEKAALATHGRSEQIADLQSFFQELADYLETLKAEPRKRKSRQPKGD